MTGIEAIFEKNAEILPEWLLQRMKRELTPEQLAQLEKFGYDKLMERLKELLAEQKERHEGGNKWIGTGGTNPAGIGGGNRTAVKVWDARAYRDYDGERELGTRNIKVALRQLRKFVR